MTEGNMTGVRIHSVLEPIAHAHGVSLGAMKETFHNCAQQFAAATGQSLEESQQSVLNRMAEGFATFETRRQLQQPKTPARPIAGGFTARFASRQAEQTLAAAQR